MMLHNHPPDKCWCGDKHSRGEAFDLNTVSIRDGLPPAEADDLLAAEILQQTGADVAAGGGIEALREEKR